MTTLAALARADDKSLQQALKALGYLKLGERARVLTALKAVPEVLDVSDAAAPSTAPEDDDEPGGDSTMVMHSAVVDIHDDGGLLKTTLRQGDAATGTPPPLATEGAAVALSGGVLVVCGGYTSAGATSQTYAWACEAPEAEGVDAKLKLLQAAKDGGALSQALYEQARRELYDV